jgi:hypothetical protein
MKLNILIMLLVAVAVQSVCLAQKTSPSPPPSGHPSSIPVPVPSPPIDYNGLRRAIDEERMNSPEPAAKSVTIAEMEKTLSDNRRLGDANLAVILSKLTLTERANAARLSRWNSESLGPQTRQALMALADGSAFLLLPTDDIPTAPAPSPAEQRRMITAFAELLSGTLPRLPNLRATRFTTYFEDRPPRQLPLSTDPDASDPLRNRPMHVVGTSRIQVAYVEGHEVAEKNGGFGDADLYASRFTTGGEFGPILYGVMMDAAQTKLVWAGWESDADGPLACFRFDAPKEKSHYSLKPASAAKTQNQFVAYRGEIVIRPSDGMIVRLSVVAIPAPEDALAVADIAVEYDRIEIGQRFYMCPVHGVALSKVPLRATLATKQDQPAPLQTQLNDVLFQQYHVFRGDVRIMQESSAQP